MVERYAEEAEYWESTERCEDDAAQEHEKEIVDEGYSRQDQPSFEYDDVRDAPETQFDTDFVNDTSATDAQLAADLPDDSGGWQAQVVAEAAHDDDAAQDQTEADPREDQMRDWLRGLDNGKGNMLRYFDAIKAEFDSDFMQLCELKLPDPVSPGIIGKINPLFWDVCGVRPAGHRLLFAKGIMALAVPE